MTRHFRREPDLETRATIVYVASKLRVGEVWHISRPLYEAAYPNSTFDDLDFTVTDRTLFYAIKRIN